MSLEIDIPAKKVTPAYNRMGINLEGDATTGGRRCTIHIPLVDESGEQVDSVLKVLTGTDYNDFWSNYSTDKNAVALLFPTLDVSTIPNTIINEI